jgi:hypothetical protein
MRQVGIKKGADCAQHVLRSRRNRRINPHKHLHVACMSRALRKLMLVGM